MLQGALPTALHVELHNPGTFAADWSLVLRTENQVCTSLVALPPQWSGESRASSVSAPWINAESLPALSLSR